MKRLKFTDSQIIAILTQAEKGTQVPDPYQECGMSDATFYKWRAKFGGREVSMMKRMRELEEKN